ncbi:MAG: ribosome maturation factor RimP [Pseudomonadota bacterium]
MSNSIALVSDLIRPTVTALGLELWGVEHVVQGRFSVLRVYIDKGDDGVTIDDCEKVSRQISGIFDVEDPIAGEYTLEVSSPGMDRPLFELGQFERYVGSVVTVRLRSPLEGRRKFKGVIQKVEADAVRLLVDDKEYVLPASAIDKANLVF